MQEKPVSYFLGWTRLDTEHNQLFLVRCTILIYWIILLSVVTCRLCCEAVMHSLSSTPFCRLLECVCCAVWLYSSSPGRLLSKNHVISSAVGSAFCPGDSCWNHLDIKRHRQPKGELSCAYNPRCCEQQQWLNAQGC